MLVLTEKGRARMVGLEGIMESFFMSESRLPPLSSMLFGTLLFIDDTGELPDDKERISLAWGFVHEGLIEEVSGSEL